MVSVFFLLFFTTTAFAMKREKNTGKVVAYRDELNQIPLPQVGDGPYKEYPDAPHHPIAKVRMPTNKPAYVCCNRGPMVNLYAKCRGCQRQLCQRCEVKTCRDDRAADTTKDYFLMVRYCADCVRGGPAPTMCDSCTSGSPKEKCWDCLGVRRKQNPVKLKWFFWQQSKAAHRKR